MKTVRMINQHVYQGPRGRAMTGETIEVSDSEAAGLIKGGYAEVVGAQPDEEEGEERKSAGKADDEPEQIPPEDDGEDDGAPETTSDGVDPETTSEPGARPRRRRDPGHREHTRRPEPKLASGDPPKTED